MLAWLDEVAMLEFFFKTLLFGFFVCIVCLFILCLTHLDEVNDILHDTTPIKEKLKPEPVPSPIPTIIPIIKDKVNTPPKCAIDSKELINALRDYATNQTIFENDLITILTKIDAPCNKCTKQEKKIILQLKMMVALRTGNQDLAKRYLKELDKYTD